MASKLIDVRATIYRRKAFAMNVRAIMICLVFSATFVRSPSSVSAGWIDNFKQYSVGIPLNPVNSDWDFFFNQPGAGIQPIEYPPLNSPKPIQGIGNGVRAAMFRAVDVSDRSLYFNVRFSHPTNPSGSTLQIAMTQNSAVDPTYKDLPGATAFVGLTIDSRIGDVLINTLRFNAVAFNNGTVVSQWDLNLETPLFQVDTWYDGRILLNSNHTADFAYKLDSSSTWIERNGLPVPVGFAFNYVAIVTSHQPSAPIWVDSVGTIQAPNSIGDFDGDGDVDGADFVIWQTNFPKATGATLGQGDADGDADVDGADFVIWQTAFLFTPNSSTSAVPEPRSALSITIGAVMTGFLCFHRRHKRS